jgi:hypothetical protein
MSPRTHILSAIAAIAFALPAMAGSEITIEDPYARAAGATAIAGAAFFVIHNTGDEADRLIAVESDAAQRVELHTHIAEGDVMRMVEVTEGFEVPAGGMHMLKRGSDHVMFMGLTGPMEQGATVNVTLVFEKSGRIELAIPVDNDRADAMPMDMPMDGASH